MTDKQQKQQIDGPLLMRICAGGVSQVLDGVMKPEVLLAIATAANAYAALQQNKELEVRVQMLERQMMANTTLNA